MKCVMLNAQCTQLPRVMAVGLAALVLLAIIWFAVESHDILCDVAFSVFIGCFFGFPPFVSGIFALFAKRPVSLVILAAASLLYGIWFAFAINGSNIFPVLFVFLVPLWLAALIVEWRGRRRMKKGDEK